MRKTWERERERKRSFPEWFRCCQGSAPCTCCLAMVSLETAAWWEWTLLHPLLTSCYGCDGDVWPLVLAFRVPLCSVSHFVFPFKRLEWFRPMQLSSRHKGWTGKLCTSIRGIIKHCFRPFSPVQGWMMYYMLIRCGQTEHRMKEWRRRWEGMKRKSRINRGCTQ